MTPSRSSQEREEKNLCYLSHLFGSPWLFLHLLWLALLEARLLKATKVTADKACWTRVLAGAILKDTSLMVVSLLAKTGEIDGKTPTAGGASTSSLYSRGANGETPTDRPSLPSNKILELISML